ncbi:MAG: hypothetical protein GXP08_13670 [Gammaproteobacteria bacterium]|nr:hypothetical protein [Gammaproteobacteria bacterium]
MRKTQLALLILFSVLLNACSSKLIYNYLDWIIEWHIADYITLDEDQETLLSDVLEKGLSWHKSSQLPLYVLSLEQLKKDVESQQLARQELVNYVRTYSRFWDNIRAYATPEIIHFLNTLTLEQIDELAANLEQQNSKLEQKYVHKSVDTLNAERSEHMIEQLERWIDDLSPEQQRTVKQWSQKLKPISKQWIVNRRIWQQKVAAQLYVTKGINNKGINETSITKRGDDPLRKKQMKKLTDKQLTELIINNRQFWTLEYSNRFNHNLNATLDLLLSLEKQLTRQQRDYFLSKLSTLSNQFRDTQQ